MPESFWKVDHSTRNVGSGGKTVTTAGTPVTLVTSSTLAKWVAIQARTINTGRIAVGGSNVVAALTTSGVGISLAAGEYIIIPCENLLQVYLDSTVSGEGVRFTYGY